MASSAWTFVRKEQEWKCMGKMDGRLDMYEYVYNTYINAWVN